MTKILICGQPSSGNRVVEAILRAAGAQTEILHTMDNICGSSSEWDGAVVIVRSEPFWGRSIDAKPDRREIIGREADSVPELVPLTATALWGLNTHRYQLPATMITYEALVSDPEAVCAHLWDFFKLPHPPTVPIVIFDANHPQHQDSHQDNKAKQAGTAQMITPTGHKEYNRFGRP